MSDQTKETMLLSPRRGEKNGMASRDKIGRDAIERLKRKLEEAPDCKPEEMTKTEAVRVLLPQIHAMREGIQPSGDRGVPGGWAGRLGGDAELVHEACGGEKAPEAEAEAGRE
jgi:hypothetical protein